MLFRSAEPDIDQDALRARCFEVMTRDGMKQAEMARLFDMAEQTFAAWLKGSCAGRNDRQALLVAKGLNSMEERDRAASILPSDIGFVETPTARKIRTHLQFAHYSPAIVAIAASLAT